MLRIAGILAAAAAAALGGAPQSRPAPAAARANWADVQRDRRTVAALVAQAKVAQAVGLAERILRAVREIKGTQSKEYLASLDSLATLHRRLGRDAKAEPLLAEALFLRRRLLGDDHADVAANLRQLADIYWNLAKYPRAVSHYSEALALYTKLRGAETMDVLVCMSNLGLIYREMGEYEKAWPLAAKAVELSRKLLGADHPDVSVSINNLASIYDEMGVYAEAERLYRQALAIRRKRLGPQHPRVGNSLNNLAALYQKIGQYAKAERLHRQALAIFRKAYGNAHPRVATSLNNLATLYADRQEYAKAVPLALEALAILKKVHGEAHPEVARVVGNLGRFYFGMGRLDKAEPLLVRAAELCRRIYGPSHPRVATTLNNLAGLYDAMGRYAPAEKLYRQALHIRRAAYGPVHPGVVVILSNLASNRAAAGRAKDALELFRQARDVTEKQTDMILGFTDDKTKLAFLRINEGDLDMLLSLVRADLADDADALALAANTVLRAKGLTLEAFGRQRDALARTNDPELARLYRELARVREEFAKTAFGGPVALGQSAFDAQYASLKSKKETLEAQLSRRSSAFGCLQRMKRADAAGVAAALPPRSALVEFVWFRVMNFRAKAHEAPWREIRYAAFVIPAGDRPAIRMIDLGPHEVIDQAVLDFRRCVAATQKAFRGVRRRIPPDVRRRARDRFFETSVRLHDLVFKPLAGGLDGVEHVLIAPAGGLSMIPFEALSDSPGRFLIERYRFGYLPAGRDVIRYTLPAHKTQGAWIVADPAFGAIPGPRADTRPAGASSRPGATQPVDARAAETRPAQPQTPDTRATKLGELKFGRLPGTADEARKLAALLKLPAARVLTGRRATEGAVKAIEAPRVLHIATHGFFLDDPAVFLRAARPRLGAATGTVSAAAAAKVRFENPLLRSGVALAGANGWADAAARGRENDGILTALEVSGLRLRGTELVVLSACETGLGATSRSEGVFGLRRAFLQAGARSLVMSLWKVPDEETVELMEHFYRRWRSGKTKADALREAQLALIRRLRARPHGAAHPFFWGGFVLIGDWR